MLLQEAENLLKEGITYEQLEAIDPIYCLLDFDKEDFCRIVDLLGIEKWADKAARWTRLLKAEEELTAKERYRFNKSRLEELENEREQIINAIETYEKGRR